MRKRRAQKGNKGLCGKGGFTLVELSVALSLFALLIAMVVSFSVLMNGYAADSKAEYGFSEDTSNLKERLSAWISENDMQNAVFTAESGTLTVTVSGILTDDVESKTVSFSDGIFSLGAENAGSFDFIDVVTFELNGSLIKCTAYRIVSDGERMESSFVIALRSANTEVNANE